MLLSNRMDPKLKELAELKAAGMVSCEFCLDIGSALSSGTHLGTDGVAVRRQALRRPDRSDLDLAAHPGSMQRLHRRAEISRLVRSSRRGHRSTVGLGCPATAEARRGPPVRRSRGMAE